MSNTLTAMQELSGIIKNRKSIIKTLREDKLISEAEYVHKHNELESLSITVWKLLAKEKEQIVDAVAYGNGRANVEDKKSLGESYFTQTTIIK